MNLKKNKVLIYTPPTLLAFAIAIALLFEASLGSFSATLTELSAWCNSIMIKCLSYIILLKSFALWAATLIIASGLIYGIFKSIRGLVKSYSTVNKLPVAGKGFLISLVKDASECFAFTHGLFRPRIYISTGLINSLTRAELNGVLLHELHHKRNRDPLRFFIYSFIRDTFFYLPIGTWFLSESIAHHELAADEHAAVSIKNPLELASALVKVSRTAKAMPSNYRSAPSYASLISERGSTTERISRLIHGKERPHSFPLLVALKSIAIALILLLSTALPMVSTAASTDSCNMEHCAISTHNDGHNASTDCESHCDMKH